MTELVGGGGQVGQWCLAAVLTGRTDAIRTPDTPTYTPTHLQRRLAAVTARPVTPPPDRPVWACVCVLRGSGRGSDRLGAGSRSLAHLTGLAVVAEETRLSARPASLRRLDRAVAAAAVAAAAGFPRLMERRPLPWPPAPPPYRTHPSRRQERPPSPGTNPLLPGLPAAYSHLHHTRFVGRGRRAHNKRKIPLESRRLVD